jgi:hypothetical protein
MEANGAAWSTHRGAEAHALPHGVIVAAGVCAGLLAGVLFIVTLAGARAAETPEQRRRRWTTAITFLAIIALISIVRVLVHPSHRTAIQGSSSPAAAGQPAPNSAGRSTHTNDTWWPLIIVGLGTAAALTAAVARRPNRRPTTDADIDDETIAVLDASLDDLRGEPDPRRAVIAAYARTERGLAARGFARQPSETPTEYLQRALTGGKDTSDVRLFGVAPLGELTALAERARFSALAVDETMRTRAIAALEALRRELRQPGHADLGRVG